MVWYQWDGILLYNDVITNVLFGKKYHSMIESDRLFQCSNCIANTLEFLQSCTKPLVWCSVLFYHHIIVTNTPSDHFWILSLDIIQWASWHWEHNKLISRSPQCSCPISYNTPFRTEMCTFLFWMVHCRICDSCIVGFVNLVSSMGSLHHGCLR